MREEYSNDLSQGYMASASRHGCVSAVVLAPGRDLGRSQGAGGGDSAAGQRLSETWSSTCHVVPPKQRSGTSNGAPTFAAVAAQKSITPIALNAFLQTPHHRMPDLHLSRDEIAGVPAYILSLRRD
jgi:hypothetical protein